MSRLLLYPSGKSAIRSKITEALCVVAKHDRLPYREPFLGGGVMTLHTLDFDRADSVWINDADAPLMCFWQAVIEFPELLLSRVESFVPSVEAWHRAKRECQKQGDIPSTPDRVADLGFQKMIVHALSHAGRGVQSGSVRGGNQQDGPIYRDGRRFRRNRIDGRWSPTSIRRQVLRYHHRFLRLEELRYTNLNFEAVIQDEAERCVLFLDPPYWKEGPGIYQHSFTPGDHERLAALLKRTKHAWVLTYGNHQNIRRLYAWAKIETVQMKSGLTNAYRTDLIITPPSA